MVDAGADRRVREPAARGPGGRAMMPRALAGPSGRSVRTALATGTGASAVRPHTTCSTPGNTAIDDVEYLVTSYFFVSRTRAHCRQALGHSPGTTFPAGRGWEVGKFRGKWPNPLMLQRSEERRVGKECVVPCR